MKAMISQPMGGLTDEQIIASRDAALQKLMESMSLCSTVFFAKGWESERGCVVEHEAAVAYGIKVIYEGDQ